MTDSRAPVGDAELPALFARVADRAGLGLAVSGGPDSTALLHLAVRWSGRVRGAPSLTVLTVDHGLRPESAAECAAVAALAATHGVPAEILDWRPDPVPDGRIQVAARAARYALLAAAARRRGLNAVLLAHTSDDVAETFLMRLARGSGVFGLAAMREERIVHGVNFVRPFLDVSKARLVATLARDDVAFADDPSNRDARFMRARIRALMPALAAAGLTTEALRETAGRLATVARAVDAAAEAFMASAVRVDELGFATLDLVPWRALPPPTARRVLSRLIHAVRGGDYLRARSQAVDALAARLAADAPDGRLATLGGAIAERCGGALLLSREPGRAGSLPSLMLRPGEEAVWDDRFAVALAGDAGSPVRIAALGAAGRRWLSGDGLRRVVPTAAIETLPGAFADGIETAIATPFGGAQAVRFNAIAALRVD